MNTHVQTELLLELAMTALIGTHAQRIQRQRNVAYLATNWSIWARSADLPAQKSKHRSSTMPSSQARQGEQTGLVGFMR
jgi:hypothetical protein